MVERSVARVCIQSLDVLWSVFLCEKTFIVTENFIGYIDVVDGTERVGRGVGMDVECNIGGVVECGRVE